MRLSGIVFSDKEPKETNVLWVRSGSISWIEASDAGEFNKTNDILIHKDGVWTPMVKGLADPMFNGFTDMSKYLELIIEALGILNKGTGEINNKLEDIESRLKSLEEKS